MTRITRLVQLAFREDGQLSLVGGIFALLCSSVNLLWQLKLATYLIQKFANL
jgi:hypothetical protein